MTTCDMNIRHEATARYRSRITGRDYYLCEVCAEQINPRPWLLYTIITRLEDKYSND